MDIKNHLSLEKTQSLSNCNNNSNNSETDENKKRSRIYQNNNMEKHPELICKSLPNGKLTYVNEAYCRYFGKKYEDLIGTSFLELVPQKHHKDIKKHVNSFTIENPIKTYEHYAINAKGEMRWQKWINQAFFDSNGKIIEFYSVGVDITELKETEKRLQQKIEKNRKLINSMMEYDKLKTEFIANISHELRTPLNLILGTLQLIEHQQKESDAQLNYRKKHHDIIKQNSYRLLRLINNLLDITKIDSGYFNINLQNCNIVSLIENITLSVAKYIENKGIKLVFDTDIEEKIMACDPDKIEKIMLNLLSNAAKFTKPGGVITVNIYDKKDNVAIAIKDTGIGIPKDKMKIIFDRFRQADITFTRTHEGCGIGLSITKSLVEMHGGKISVKSKPGKGSEFLIELPVKLIKNNNREIIINNFKKNYIESINMEFSDIYQ